MLKQVEQAKEQWGGTNSAIDTWLNARKQLLVEYCQLAGLPPFERTDKALPANEAIESFCELLMDYISAGHFEVYDQIASQGNGSNGSLTDEVYPKISETTDQALQFNDAYADICDDQSMASFDMHLSQLGQSMEDRFELEDRLIQTLHQEHL